MIKIQKQANASNIEDRVNGEIFVLLDPSQPNVYQTVFETLSRWRKEGYKIITKKGAEHQIRNGSETYYGVKSTEEELYQN